MENKANDRIGQNEKKNANTNANNLRNREHSDETIRLSDYPDGNLDEDLNTDSIPGNQTDQPTVAKSIDEATDPSKLSDL